MKFFEYHPHPLLGINKDRVIEKLNPAAERVFGQNLIGETCCHVLFGSDEPCIYDCLTRVFEEEYSVCHVSGLRGNVGQISDENYITLFQAPARGCFMAIHPVPSSFERIRAVRAITNSIMSALTVEEVIQHFRKFLTAGDWRPPYRVREYTTDNPYNPTRLICTWHDADIEPQRPYVSSLLGRMLALDDEFGRVSFHAVNNFCLTMVACDPQDVEIFTRDFHANQIEPAHWVAKSQNFEGLHLLALLDTDRAVLIFNDGEESGSGKNDPCGRHTWLDIPFGYPGYVIRKMSITPQGRIGRFTREEMEELSTLFAVANTQIENILARETETRAAKLDAVHEVSQPAFLALTSIEWLRRRDRENNIKPEHDLQSFYAKKNLETAIRMVAFLNESPLISRDDHVASHSPSSVTLLGDVIAPIVNMIRHEEFLHERTRNKRRTPLNAESLRDLHLRRDAHFVSWKYRKNSKIVYDDFLETVRLHVDQYRLQQVFYNLFSNAAKFHDREVAMEIQVACRRDTDFEEKYREILRSFYVIDLMDDGIGIQNGEENIIFGFGKRGSKSVDIKGSGRGLFFVREILLSIGGEIYVLQKRKPTCFRILIPAACRDPDWYKTDAIDRTKQKREELRSILGLSID